MGRHPGDSRACMRMYTYILQHPNCRLTDIANALCWTSSRVYNMIPVMDFNGYLISCDEHGRWQVFKRIMRDQRKKETPAPSPTPEHRETEVSEVGKPIINHRLAVVRAWRCG